MSPILLAKDKINSISAIPSLPSLINFKPNNIKDKPKTANLTQVLLTAADSVKIF